jgi:adenylate kinase family enzyme
MPDRILIYGNAGSGKTTLARTLAGSLGVAHLDLDSIAWREPLVRHPLAVTLDLLAAFVRAHEGWVIEGCYGAIVAAATALCTELMFRNPGIDACITRCRKRPWEPSKFEPSSRARTPKTRCWGR